MLILSRKSNEAIHIGNDIVIRVLAVNGGQVRIGIEAPAALAVHRDEIYRLIQAENNLSVETTPQAEGHLHA